MLKATQDPAAQALKPTEPAFDAKTAEAWQASLQAEASGSYSEAIDALTESYKSHQKSYLFNVRLGYLSNANNNAKDAETYYEQASKLAPTSVEAKIGHTSALLAQYKFAQAKTTALQIVHADPLNYYGSLWHAYSLRALGKGKNAEPILDRLTAAYPTDTSALIELRVGPRGDPATQGERPGIISAGVGSRSDQRGRRKTVTTAVKTRSMHTHIDAVLSPSRGSLRERDNAFYELLAGGAKTRLLEGFIDLGVPELLGRNGAMAAGDICRELGIQPHRGWKFLHLLSLNGLLDRLDGTSTGDEARFALYAPARQFFGEDGTGGYYFRDLVVYWRNVACLPLVDVLRGMELPEAVRWPPPGMEQAEHLETWMRVTAEGALATLKHSGALGGARRLLDVGGGDGTIGCAMANEYPELEVTVFNLPASAALARRNIAAKGMEHGVAVHEGDFLADELPHNFDRVMFSRVLCDWTPEVCGMLFEKSRRALIPDGRLVINEALVEGNLDYTISWEFRYLYYDTFGRMLFKTLDVYRELLSAAGFEIERMAPMRDDAFYSVIIARPKV